LIAMDFHVVWLTKDQCLLAMSALITEAQTT
jgi:hypothetical protein